MRNAETKGYVSWADVMTVWRWFEAAYSVSIQVAVNVKCPQGEQLNHMYTFFHVYDADGQVVPLPRKLCKIFPTHKHQTYPGMLLAGLYELDSLLGEVRVYVEPTVAVKPRAELAAV